MSKQRRWNPTSTHWGNYRVESDGKKILAVEPYAVDKEPTPIGQSLLDALDPDCRIPQPMVRAGYLKAKWHSDGAGRGREPFVPVSWETALELAAEALQHTKGNYGNQAIYGSSNGWASAGRFHHAQSQIHRFLNLFGGYTASVNSYSFAAAEVIMSHVLGTSFWQLIREAPTPTEIAANAKTLLLFGGAALKNSQVNVGGIGAHSAKTQLLELKRAGVDIINISPIADDVDESLGAEWVPCRPGSDVAIMLGIAYTLVNDNLHDKDFLEKYTVGFERFLPYLLGKEDGQPKDIDWASRISGVPADTIQTLAWRLVNDRSVMGISWSLQRQAYGEQTYWMFTTLGAMLGHIGLPGGGVAYGYGCTHNMGFGGRRVPPYSMGALEQEIGVREEQAGRSFIPVARLTDMLNHPGETYHYNGQQLTYPDIRLIFWAGGNPYHHHQDLSQLRHAWTKPETVIVNEAFWTATARHADIVFPCTTMLERNDLGGSSYDGYISPMRKAVEPFAEARSDYAVFSALAGHLGFEEAFTEGRDEMAWVKHLYEITRAHAAAKDVELPEFDRFWQGEQLSVSEQLQDAEFTLERFRRDPEKYPLNTPSGKVEIFSDTIASFDYADCQGHPRWFDREEWLGSSRAKTYPLHLISNQPRTQLHSQFDHGRTSRARKIQGRERARINPKEARSRGIADGDIVRLFNDRGACLAGIEVSDCVSVGVIELPTGAWFDPQDGLEVHGNPNVLTIDQGSSNLAQGCTAHSCLVEVERYDGELPAISVYSQPDTIDTPQ